jgi:ATP-dependent helicase Lhr and Lhr-like helicase
MKTTDWQFFTDLPVPTITAFDSLHEKVRRWIWQQGWEGLRDVQERSIPILLGGERDLVIMAATAGGKTEAAFLPIVSSLAGGSPAACEGFQAIYVSPMRALINDQFGRMESLCGELDVEVTKWHGDVSESVKARARKNPSGIVLITPESLEALLVRRGKEVARLFRALRYVVIDEMHVFLDDPRGKQLQSVLYRIDLASGARPVRVGLSATLADEDAARVFLRPLDPARVDVLPPGPGAPPIKLQLRGYVRPTSFRQVPQANREGETVMLVDPADAAIARHLFETHRGHRSLIFAGARGAVETITVRLSEMTEAAGVPDEFFAHHGNLSREHREHAEQRMKDKSRPASIVCTTTLELGIDVGEIEAVAQLGPGHTVSGMRQRLGRSGRRPGPAAIMRVYVKESELTESANPLDALRTDTVQAIAMLNLMLRKWNEPPEPRRLHLSTLLHQVMALIGQRGGVTIAEAWEVLVRSGTFGGVDVELFKRLLQRMGESEVGLLEQARDGTLLAGPAGERLLESRDIFAVFVSPEEYKVIAEGGRAIGRVPGDSPFTPGEMLMLAGRRWRIAEVDTERRELSVRSARGGNPPVFGGDRRPPSDGVVEEMRRVWEDLSFPPYLDANAKQLVVEARTTYDRLGLRGSAVARHDGQILLFPWVGERRQQALILALASHELEPAPLGVAVGISADKESTLVEILSKLASGATPDALELAKLVENKEVEKFDSFLGDELLTLAWGRDRLDIEGLPDLASRLLAGFAGVDQ